MPYYSILRRIASLTFCQSLVAKKEEDKRKYDILMMLLYIVIPNPRESERSEKIKLTRQAAINNAQSAYSASLVKTQYAFAWMHAAVDRGIGRLSVSRAARHDRKAHVSMNELVSSYFTQGCPLTDSVFIIG